MESVKIGIGPHYNRENFGGVLQHIKSIHNNSRFSTELVSYGPFIKYFNILKNKYNFSQKSKFLIRYFNRQVSRYNLLHLHGHPELEELFQTIIEKDIPFIYSIHMNFFKSDILGHKYENLLRHQNNNMIKFAKHSQKNVIVSEWLKGYFDERGVDSIHIPNGFDSDFLDNYLDKGIKRENFVTSVGDISNYKRSHLINEVASYFPDYTFFIVGKNSDKKSFQDLCGKEIEDNIIFKQKISNHELFQLYQKSKFCIHPSKNDTLPTCVMEALYFNTPVFVLEDSFGPKEIVSRVSNDLILSNYSDLVGNLDSFNFNRDFSSKVKDFYSWKNISPQIDEIYKEYK